MMRVSMMMMMMMCETKSFAKSVDNEYLLSAMERI